MYLHRGGYRYIYNVNRKDIKAIQLSSTFGWSRNTLFFSFKTGPHLKQPTTTRTWIFESYTSEQSVRNSFVHQQNLQISNAIGIYLKTSKRANENLLPWVTPVIFCLYTFPSCLCIFWHVSSHYLPPIPTGLINIIGITFTLNIHANIHTILKMCLYCTLNSSLTNLGIAKIGTLVDQATKSG